MKRKLSFILVLMFIFLQCSSLNSFAAVKEISISYQAHVSDIGWQNFVTSTSSSVKTAGTTGQGKKLEALKIILNDSSGKSMIKYRAHVANLGWQNWKSSNEMAGTTGQSLAIEAVQITLNEPYASQYDIVYRMHVSNKGWLNWTKNGGVAGSTGISLQAEAIQIKIVKKNSIILPVRGSELTKPDLTYTTHIQNIGWQSATTEGKTAGTTGRGFRMEAIMISLKDFDNNSGISYQAHVSNIGWQGWKTSGQTAGTTGRALAIEAIQIKLSDSLSPYFDVYYRMHCANKGWLGWAKNGEIAGTIGGGLQAEAIEIKLVAIGTSVDRGGKSYVDLTNTANNVNTATNSLIVSNLSKIKLIKQGSKTCKATAIAQSLNIIMGYNKYTTSSLGGSSCKNIDYASTRNTYNGSDGNTYIATYKQDSYIGSRTEQQSQIDKALSAGLPIVVTVHKLPIGTPTMHHWVTIIGKNGNTYDIIDPATGTQRTMTSAKYDFGLADYSNGKHYGYVSFTKK